MLVALALAHTVAQIKGDPSESSLARYSAASVAEQTGLVPSQIEALGRRIAAAKAPLALPPGSELLGTNAARFAEAVQILNHVSGAIGRTVVFGPDHNVARLARFRDVTELAGQLRGGEGFVLLLHAALSVAVLVRAVVA